MGPFSAVTLGIFWISERVLLNQINVETARDYLNAFSLAPLSFTQWLMICACGPKIV